MIITFLSISILLNIILVVNLLLKRSKRIKLEAGKKKHLRSSEEIDIAISEKAAELLKEVDETSGIPESTNYGIHGIDTDFINKQADTDNTFSPATTEPIEVKDPEPDESSIALVRDYIELPNVKKSTSKDLFGKINTREEAENIAQSATEILKAVDKKEKDSKKKPGRKKKIAEKPVETKKDTAKVKKTKKAGK